MILLLYVLYLACILMLDAILIGLAVAAFVDIWFKPDSPLQVCRAYCEAWGGKWAQIAACPICLATNLACAVAGALYVCYLVLILAIVNATNENLLHWVRVLNFVTCIVPALLLAISHLLLLWLASTKLAIMFREKNGERNDST